MEVRWRSHSGSPIDVLSSFFVTMFLVLALAGCGPYGQESKLVGSWQINVGLGTGTLTYSKDHTSVTTITGLVGGSSTGEWHIDGNKLIETTRTSTIDKSSIGKQESSEIIKLDESVLIVKAKDRTGTEQVITLTRIK